MREEIINILKQTDEKVGYIFVDGEHDTYITFDIYSTEPINFSDDENKSKLYKIQVDIFSKTNYEKLENQVQQLMKENNFLLVDEVDLYENDTKLYHKGIRYEKEQ